MNYKLDKTSESQEQTALITWAMYEANRLPGIDLLHAIPNGGHRHIAVARQMRREGVRTGVPDLCLPVARCGYHGLYIELKAVHRKPKRGGSGGVDPKQARWIKRLNEEGFLAIVAYGFLEARNIIEQYLNNHDPRG